MKLLNVNDTNIAVYEQPGEGEPLLLLHPGGFFASFVWDEFIQLINKSHRVIAIDIRGHGNSAHPESGYDVSVLAKDIARVLQELKIDHVHLIGSSLGAELGVYFAATYPELIQSLTLIDGGILNIVGPYGERDGTKEDFINEILNSPVPEFENREEFVDFMNENAKDFASVADRIKLYKTLNGKYTFKKRADITAEILSSLCDLDMITLYQNITCPVLFLPAELEPKLELKLQMIEKIKEKITVTDTKVIPESKHIMMLNHSNEIYEHFLKFLARLKVSS
ncbi:alpha/beta fold hydrolase [Fictibacillus sp. BK138]|uniref:alpha/beta fold hydrolase n=1 Tax=Fictibacillus sp. BK138 TaxID=2512121 RepID=UPI0010D39531|nr:alpha/beta hydrolase [Fictibacillus sp. BK138]RZT15522.1 pimeloyl-ACP methyl ester carboxylesterase [Fictibacillus sp. BK138]